MGEPGQENTARADPAIQVEGLVKRFGPVTAVDGISFAVGRGELFGFLGPNGAGKTTTINMLTGLARPERGSIRIGGIDCSRSPKAAQELIGVVPDESNLYPELTGFENLAFCGALYGLRRAEREARARELLAAFGLAEAAGRKFGGYSRGMKRKLALAAGVIHRPEVLFLDEPTTGIDVASARQARALIAGWHAAGMTIFLTTHYIEEAERLCDRIAFMAGGRIVRTGSPAELMQPVLGRHQLDLALAEEAAAPSGSAAASAAALAAHFPAIEFRALDRTRIRATAPEPISVAPLARFIEEQGLTLAEARRVRPSLEDVFVEATGIEATALRKEREKPAGGP